MKKIVSITLVLIMLFAVTAVSFSAASDDDYLSPGGKEYYGITVQSEGKGSASSDKNKVNVKASGEDGYVTLTAIEDGGYFTKWTLTGDYTPISGDETSKVFVIQPASDVIAVAKFVDNKEDKDKDSTPDQKPTEKSGSSSSTSPKTGDPTFMIITMIIMAMGLGIFAVKKIKE